MPTNEELQQISGLIAALRERAVDQLAPKLVERPELAEELTRRIDQLVTQRFEADAKAPPPADLGLAELIGLGPSAAANLRETRQPHAVDEYDETVTAERLLAVGDLYYLYQHEKIGVFQVMLKLQEQFTAGTVRLSAGAGAYGLYRYDRRRVLRYTQRDRLQAYRRVFGYTQVAPAPGARPNTGFHNLFVNFLTQVAEFFRDKRVSEVIRPRANDPSFGSIAVVRRAGLDLRNNAKFASYGHVAVLRIEMLQLLDEAFRILGADDIRKLFGAETAWDVVEEVQRRYLHVTHTDVSPRSRMAAAGRDVLAWLAQDYILNSTRSEFEAQLLQIGDRAEEWVTSAEALGVARRRQKSGPATWERPSAVGPARVRVSVAENDLAAVD